MAANYANMPTISPPQPRWRRLLTIPPLYDALIAVVTCIGGVWAAVSLLSSSDPSQKVGGIVAIAVAIVVAALTAVKAALEGRREATKDSTHELEGCLYTLHDILAASVASDHKVPELRITVHTLKSNGRDLVQVMNYVGSNRGSSEKKAGRSIPVSCGVTGRAYRIKRPATFQRATENYDDYLRVLTEEQGFTEDQARKLDPLAMSAVAFPLVDEDQVEGIVYLDSVDPNFFTAERMQVIGSACVGIARFVKRKSGI